jgi:hypothetical protein
MDAGDCHDGGRGDRRADDARRGLGKGSRGEQVMGGCGGRGCDRPSEADQERHPAGEKRGQRSIGLTEVDVVTAGVRQGRREFAERQGSADGQHAADHPEGEHQLVAAHEEHRESRRGQNAGADHPRNDEERRGGQAEGWPGGWWVIGHVGLSAGRQSLCRPGETPGSRGRRPGRGCPYVTPDLNADSRFEAALVNRRPAGGPSRPGVSNLCRPS